MKSKVGLCLKSQREFVKMMIASMVYPLFYAFSSALLSSAPEGLVLKVSLLAPAQGNSGKSSPTPSNHILPCQLNSRTWSHSHVLHWWNIPSTGFPRESVNMESKNLQNPALPMMVLAQSSSVWFSCQTTNLICEHLQKYCDWEKHKSSRGRTKCAFCMWGVLNDWGPEGSLW